MIDNIRLNNMPSAILATDKSERSDIVAGGRLLMAEYNGREGNRARKNNGYASSYTDSEYKKLVEGVSQKTLMYCAKYAANEIGKDAPADYAEFLKNSRFYANSKKFFAVLSGIAEEVLTPTLPYVTSNVLGDLANTATVGLGETYEVTVRSNYIPLFNDSSWGASRSVPKEYLYDKVIKVNPKPRTASFKIKWYQLVGNAQGGADVGRYYNALAAGLSNKILAMWNSALATAVTNSALVPAYLSFNSFSTANWIAASKAVSMANGLPRTSLMAFGDITALSNVLPTGTAQDAALTTQLGEAHFARGFVGTAYGVPLVEIQNAFVAGTVNDSQPTAIIPNDVVYITARASDGYAPVTVVWEDSPITLELTPDTTADGTIDINMTASVALCAPMAQKMAVISNV